MKKVILIFVTIVLSGLLYAKDNKSTDALLREIDGIIKNRQTYGAEKEARIADLKKLLAEATSDEQRYGFCGRLFDEYRAYNLDSSFVYAQRKEELAHRMDKLDYLDDAAMNMAEVMGTTGMYKEGFFVKFGGNLFFISTVFFFLNPIKSCRYVCFLVTLKTPHH